jgi:hypothetical protein
VKLLRYLWVSPASLVGLLLAAIAMLGGARAHRVQGALEVAGGGVHRLVAHLPEGCRFGAITLGHVIVGLDEAALERARSHEQVHVRQYERWGIFFFPAYLGSSLLQLARGRDPYRDNCFEVEAFAREMRRP